MLDIYNMQKNIWELTLIPINNALDLYGENKIKQNIKGIKQ